VKAFNQLYFKKGKLFESSSLVPADKYYFPLDGLNQWNNIYGKRGFYQYQSVVPPKDAISVTNEMLQIIKKSGQSSFLTVLKTFGAKQSGGLLSFPMPGLTLAVDLPNRGEETLSLMKRLDEIVATAGGRLYLAKDARVSKEFFQSSYPEYEKFEKLRDPKFSSNMSRRLMGW
jgi:FAD/FMN-containing dehydrogenase